MTTVKERSLLQTAEEPSLFSGFLKGISSRVKWTVRFFYL